MGRLLELLCKLSLVELEFKRSRKEEANFTPFKQKNKTEMSVLTRRQRDELNRAIHDYFLSVNFTESAKHLQQEAELADSITTTSVDTVCCLLEKKWTSVVRLQKKIMDMESKMAQMQLELDRAPQLIGAGTIRNKNGDIVLIRAPEKYKLLQHRQPVTALAFHPLFNTLASASEDCTIKLWDSEAGEFEQTLKGHTKAVHSVVFDPKQPRYLASCSADLTIKIWDADSEYRCIQTLQGHDHSVSSIDIVPSGELLISASRDKSIRVWEMATGYCVKTLSGHDDWVRCVKTCAEGTSIVSASNDQTVRVWDLSTYTPKCVLRGHEHVVEYAIFAPALAFTFISELTGVKLDAKNSSHIVISASRDRSIRIWDTTNETCIHTFNGHDNWVRCLFVSASGTHLYSCSDDKTLKIWDLKTGRCARTIEAHNHFCQCVALASNGLVATGSVENDIKLWSN